MAGDAPYSGRLLIGCADRPGIVAAVSGFLLEQGANIVSSHQYSTDPTGGRFFMRTEFFLRELGAPTGATEARWRFEELFATEVADGLDMDWEIRYWGERQRIAILVSRHDHCLVDLLWRWRRGELDGEVVAVISNHARPAPRGGGRGRPLPPRARARRATSQRAEAAMLELLTGEADLLVLARYMQILSGEFLERLGSAGDQHPPFLPARLRRRRPVPAGARARSQADRRDRALRHRAARRRADHRPGRRARRPPSERRRPRARRAATSSAWCSPVRWRCTSTTA